MHGRWRFRSLQRRDVRGIKRELNSGAECLKTHTLAAPAPWVSLRAPETLSQAPGEATAGAGSPEPRKTQPNLHTARPSSRPRAGREPPTQSQRSHEHYRLSLFLRVDTCHTDMRLFWCLKVPTVFLL